MALSKEDRKALNELIQEKLTLEGTRYKFTDDDRQKSSKAFREKGVAKMKAKYGENYYSQLSKKGHEAKRARKEALKNENSN